MLAGLFRDAVAELVHDTLDGFLSAAPGLEHPALCRLTPSADGQGSPLVAVVGDVALGRALGAIGKRRAAGRAPAYALRVAAPAKARGARKLEGVLVAESPLELPLEAGALAVLIGVGAMTSPEPGRWLAEWTRVVRPGGGVILVDRCAAPVATRHALCARMLELEQRHSGRAVVTSGLIAPQPARTLQVA